MLELKKKTLFKDLKVNQSCFVPLSNQFFKIEYVQEEGERPYLRLYMSLNTPISFDLKPSGIFKVRVRKVFEPGQLGPYYIIDSDSHGYVEKFLEPKIKLIFENNQDALDTDSFITLDEIIARNGEKEDSSKREFWTIPTFINVKIPQSEQEQRSVLLYFKNPDEDTKANLVSLEDSIPDIYGRFEKLNEDKISAEIRKIFLKFGINEELQEDIKDGLKINSLLSGNVKRMLSNSGGILLGPFGSGKTFIVRNAVREIFVKLLGCGYAEVNMAEKTGGGGSQYINAGMRAVNNTFLPVIRKIQREKRPYLLFIDEGDPFIRDPVHDDDVKAIAGVKNLLNPRTYPGLIVCINTNLEENRLDPGIKERRLKLIDFPFPPKQTHKTVWKAQEDILNINFTEEQLERLGSLGADVLGLDGIDSFSENMAGKINRNNFNFEEFIELFYNYAIKRINEYVSTEIRKLSQNAYVNSQEEVTRIEEERDNRLKILKRRFEEKISQNDDLPLEVQAERRQVETISKIDKLYIILGIPTSIHSGVVKAQELKANYFIREGYNVLVVNHWWDDFKYFNKYKSKWQKVTKSPYNYKYYSGGKEIDKNSFYKFSSIVDYIIKLKPRSTLVLIETHTFFQKKQALELREKISNIVFIYTIHQFIPYFRISDFEEKKRLINSNLPNEYIEKIKQNNYVGRNERHQEELLEFSDFIVAISKVIGIAISKLYPEFSSKIRVIENSVDLVIEDDDMLNSQTNTLRNNLGIPNDKVVFGYIGRVELKKLGDYGEEKTRLVQFINKLFSKTSNTIFLFVGISDYSKVNLIRDWGIEARFVHRIYTSKGWIEDDEIKLQFINMVDCLVQPVKSENLYGLAVIEAIYLKKLVMSCPGELTICDCSNLDLMIDIATKIANGEKFEEHIEETFKKASSKFSSSVNMLKYLELFEKV
ncbi:MAG: AAA family ATPase [Candidatus Woesearchaeota archaeon]